MLAVIRLTSEIRKVAVGSHIIQYTLIIKNVKNINMHVSEKGEILVSANAYCPLNKIDAFVADKVDWILKCQQAARDKADVFYHADDQVLNYLGAAYPIRLVLGQRKGVKLEHHECIVYLHEAKEAPSLIRSFLIRQCEKIFMAEVEAVYELMSRDYVLPVPRLKIREMNSRWGSCMPSKRQITLNVRCIYYQREFLRYVVIHEFAHFIQPNHSKQFYHIIEKYMPDYKRCSKLFEAPMVKASLNGNQ